MKKVGLGLCSSHMTIILLHTVRPNTFSYTGQRGVFYFANIFAQNHFSHVNQGSPVDAWGSIHEIKNYKNFVTLPHLSKNIS